MSPHLPNDAAVLAFLDGWRELQHGDITAGGSLVVRYEPTRFAEARAAAPNAEPDAAPDAAPNAAPKVVPNAGRVEVQEIVGYARFLPGGQIRHATLRRRRVAKTAAVAAEIPVPPESKQVELWFQRIDADGHTVWDSRFGENYRFDVVRPRPRPIDSLHLRTGADVDPAVITVAEDAAVKENAFAGRPGYPPSGASLQTSLHVAARVRAPIDPRYVWVDVHFFDAQASFIHGDTLPLRHAGAAGDAHELFVLDGVLYQGSVATPGSVTPRPDVRTVQYRLYCQLGDRIVTDGVLHRCELATDAVSG